MVFKMAVNLNTHNKQQQIFTTKSQQIDSTLTGEDDIPSKVHQGIVIERGDMKNTNEKADNILVLQMVFAATENQQGFCFHSLLITRMCSVVLNYLP